MRKLATFFAIMAICLAQTAISQDITFRFTGALSNDNYIRLDSVKVQNTSRSWSETVVYPDTVLTFTNVGIAEAQCPVAELSAYPNPSNGTTNVTVALPEDGNAVLQLFNLAGQKVAERSLDLQAGNNLFNVRLQNPQVYLLAVTTPQGRSTIKLLNRSAGEGNEISFRGNVVEKRQTSQPFQSGDVLKITGYATINGTVVTSPEVRQQQTTSENFTLYFPSEGALAGVYTVGVNRKVYFSCGNLQYTTSGAHAVAGGGTQQGTWRFAEHPWDTIGSPNAQISSSYAGWIDLFGWGTSGYHDPNDPYNTNYQPYSTSTSTVYQLYNEYGYGPSINMPDHDLTGTSANYDWGVYNGISNGGNQPGLWRTLSKTEWDTLLNRRSTTSGIRFAKGKVNGVQGLIIVPDNWRAYIFNLRNTNDRMADFSSNVLSSAEWTTLHNAGCAFLPVTGIRTEFVTYSSRPDGYYWTSNNYQNQYANYIEIDGINIQLLGSDYRYMGYAVRLVQDAH